MASPNSIRVSDTGASRSGERAAAMAGADQRGAAAFYVARLEARIGESAGAASAVRW